MKLEIFVFSRWENALKDDRIVREKQSQRANVMSVRQRMMAQRGMKKLHFGQFTVALTVHCCHSGTVLLLLLLPQVDNYCTETATTATAGKSRVGKAWNTDWREYKKEPSLMGFVALSSAQLGATIVQMRIEAVIKANIINENVIREECKLFFSVSAQFLLCVCVCLSFSVRHCLFNWGRKNYVV